MLPKNRSTLLWLCVIALLLLLAVTACGAPASDAPEEAQTAAEQAQSTDEEEPAPTEPPPTQEPIEEPPTQAPEPTAPPALEPLPPERQLLNFETEDGRSLEGYYYPAKVNPAPLIVLMHWAGGDMTDWDAIGPWLQNRQDELAAAPQWIDASISYRGLQGDAPWLDPSWFPILPDEATFGVFAFNFAGWGNSEGSGPDDWIRDAEAALVFASQLPGVDPARITAMGASIGADGAPDGCYLFNMHGDVEGTCLGALSLSPGNYLMGSIFTETYADVIQHLEEDVPPAIVHCLAAEGDSISLDTCSSAQGEHYQTFIFPGDYHGMMLVRPDIEPLIMPIILGFLEAVYGIDLQ